MGGPNRNDNIVTFIYVGLIIVIVVTGIMLVSQFYDAITNPFSFLDGYDYFDDSYSYSSPSVSPYSTYEDYLNDYISGLSPTSSSNSDSSSSSNNNSSSTNNNSTSSNNGSTTYSSSSSDSTGKKYYKAHTISSFDSPTDTSLFNVTVSSRLKSTNDDITYQPINLVDNDITTAWSEGVEGYGVGEKVNFYYFGSQPFELTNIQLYNGYVKSEKAYNTNGTPSKITIILNQQEVAEVDLVTGTRSPQEITFDTPLILPHDSVLSFRIDDVAEAVDKDETRDTLITEVGLAGHVQ